VDGETVGPGKVGRVTGGVFSVREVGRVVSGALSAGVRREVDTGCWREVEGV